MNDDRGLTLFHALFICTYHAYRERRLQWPFSSSCFSFLFLSIVACGSRADRRGNHKEHLPKNTAVYLVVPLLASYFVYTLVYIYTQSQECDDA